MLEQESSAGSASQRLSTPAPNATPTNASVDALASSSRFDIPLFVEFPQTTVDTLGMGSMMAEAICDSALDLPVHVLRVSAV